MSLHIVKNLDKPIVDKLIHMVYENFKDLEKNPELKHNKQELHRLLTAPNSKIVLLIDKKKILGYLIGEQKDLVDGRRVFYISYLFTSKYHRNNGLASKLLNYIVQLSKHHSYDGILLTCNIENKDLENFYLIRGFMPDHIYRTYKQYETLYRHL